VRQPDFRWLNTTTLFALIAVTVQAAYFLSRWRREDPWWHVGLSGVAMMTLLGTSVWEGHPGAATRVLLPMGIAFAVSAVRERVPLTWLLAASLTVFSGVLALWHVPDDPREFAAGRFANGAYVVRLDTGWHGLERDGRKAWVWSAREGRLAIETAPRSRAPLRVRVRVRGFAPRTLEIREFETVLWRGAVGAKPEWFEITVMPAQPGKLSLTLRSDDPPSRESDHPDARMLACALYDVEVR